MMKADNDRAIIKHATDMQNRFNLTGKTILDIGCGNGFMVKHIAEKYKPRHIFGIDRRLEPMQRDCFSFKSGDARKLPFEENTFDIVYSISTFEHINGIERTLDEIKRVLKPYGKFYATFAPVWTSISGHHCYSYWPAFSDECKEMREDRDEEIMDIIPPWGHLYMNEVQMREHLWQMKLSEGRISAIIEYIYHSNDINRCSASQIKKYIMNCGMIVRYYYEGVTFSRRWVIDQKGTSELTTDIIRKVADAQYNVNDLGIVYIKMELEKYESFAV